MITKWNEMSIADFEKKLEIESLPVSDEEKEYQLAALCGGITYDQLLNQPLSMTQDMMTNIAFLYRAPREVKTQREYHIGTRDYTLLRDSSEMTTAQYIDFQSIVSLPTEENIAELMAIVLVPKGHTYNEGYNHNEIVEEIRNNFNIEDALSVASFFIKRFRRSINSLLNRVEALTLWHSLTNRNKAIRQAMKRSRKAIRDLRSGYGSL